MARGTFLSGGRIIPFSRLCCTGEMTTYTTKRVYMYGQWVEVKVIPSKPTPEPSVTVFPTDTRNATSIDVTATDTGGRRRGKKRDPED